MASWRRPQPWGHHKEQVSTKQIEESKIPPNCSVSRPANQFGHNHRQQTSALGSKSTSTFAPNFISLASHDTNNPIQKGGEALEGTDFSGKRWVWVRDQELAFIKGFVSGEEPDGRLRVMCDDGTVR